MTRYYLYDSYTDEYAVAEFAKKKDNRKRNALIGAGVAGAGVAARYGGAAAKTALAERRLYNGAGGSGLQGQKMNINTKKDALSGGAKGQLKRDVEAVSNVFRARNQKGAMRNRAIREKLGQAGKSARSYAGLVGNTVKSAAGTTKGRLALAGAGLGAAALAGGAAYGINRRRKQRNSIRNRVRQLLGR